LVLWIFFNEPLSLFCFQAIQLSLEEARCSGGFGAGGISQEEQVGSQNKTSSPGRQSYDPELQRLSCKILQVA
jgi:hypothetical protein